MIMDQYNFKSYRTDMLPRTKPLASTVPFSGTIPVIKINNFSRENRFLKPVFGSGFQKPANPNKM